MQEFYLRIVISRDTELIGVIDVANVDSALDMLSFYVENFNRPTTWKAYPLMSDDDTIGLGYWFTPGK